MTKPVFGTWIVEFVPMFGGAWKRHTAPNQGRAMPREMALSYTHVSDALAVRIRDITTGSFEEVRRAPCLI